MAGFRIKRYLKAQAHRVRLWEVLSPHSRALDAGRWSRQDVGSWSRGRQLVRGSSIPGKTQHQAGSLPVTELSCRDLFKRRKKTDTQFAEQQRGDVESHLIGLGTPKGIACSTKIGPVGGGQGVQHG